MTHAFVLRSPVAHAHIKRIDAAAARRMPGVLFVATAEWQSRQAIPPLPPPTSGIALWSGSSRLRERILPFGYLPNADARAAEDASNLTDAAHLHSNAVAVLLETEDKKPRNYSRRGMHGLGKHRLRCLTHPAPGVLLVGTDHEEEPRKTRLCAGSGGSCQAPFLGQWLRPRGLSLMGASESRKSSGMRSSIEWSATEPQAAAERVL